MPREGAGGKYLKLRLIRARADMETILLVDDNPLRASLRQTLLAGGRAASVRAVVRASDAAEALCLVESEELAQGLALVITGHVMSGISGPEFVAEFRSRVPEVPVLVLGAVPGAEEEYAGISGVYYSETTASDELRALVGRLLGAGQRRTA